MKPVYFLIAVGAIAGQISSASAQYGEIVQRDLAWIISEEEKATFKTLRTSAEKEEFLRNFWERRDPTPGTPANEYREEHYRRLEAVRQQFAHEGIPAWRTDRARIYIVHGPPASRSVEQDMEIWTYRNLTDTDGRQRHVQLVFRRSAGIDQPLVGQQEYLDLLSTVSRTGTIARYRLESVTPIGGHPSVSQPLSVSEVMLNPGELLELREAAADRRNRRLEAAMAEVHSSISFSSVPFELKVWRFKVLDRKAVVVAGQIPVEAWGNKRDVLEIDLLCQLLDSSDQPLDRFERTLAVSPGDPVVFHEWFYLPNSRGTVECLAAERSSDGIGHTQQSVKWLDDGDSLSLSDLLLTQWVQTDVSNNSPNPLIFHQVQFIPNPQPSFDPELPIILYYQVFDRRGVGAEGDLFYDYQLQNGDRVIYRSGARRLDGKVQRQALRLNFSNLEDGSYTLQLKVRDREKNYSIAQAHFNLKSASKAQAPDNWD